MAAFKAFFTFTFIFINVGGLKTAPRNGHITHSLALQKCDFFFLQETHLAQDKIAILKDGFPKSEIYFAPGLENMCGAAIVDRLGIKPTHIDINPDGRFLILSFIQDKRTVTLITIYAPSGASIPKQTARNEFFKGELATENSYHFSLY